MNNFLEEYVPLAREKIKQHAVKAIDALQEQLLSAKSPVKIAKLKSRISAWEKSLEILENNNDKKEASTKVAQ